VAWNPQRGAGLNYKAAIFGAEKGRVKTWKNQLLFAALHGHGHALDDF
jgi:hypothetical protein